MWNWLSGRREPGNAMETTLTEHHPRFSDVIRKKMRTTVLAERIDRDPSTVTSWLNRNAFPEKVAVKIAEVIGLDERTPETLAAAYEMRFSKEKQSLPRPSAHSRSLGLDRGLKLEPNFLHINGQRIYINALHKDKAPELMNQTDWETLPDQEKQERGFRLSEKIQMRHVWIHNVDDIAMVGALLSKLADTRNAAHFPTIVVDQQNLFTMGLVNPPPLRVSVYTDAQSLRIAREQSQGQSR